LRVVKHDGQLHTAELVDRDESLQLAVIRFEPESKLQPLTIETRISPRPGDSVLAMGNPFKIAEGPEPISVTRGIVAGFTHLDAELGERPFPYRGEVMLLDAVTSNPGAAGGPVVDLDGNWVGLIGREVRSRLTNTFLNYGYRSTPVADYLNRVLSDSPTETTETDAQSAGPGYHGIKLSRFGYRRKLAFVANVKEGSPAETAGIQEGDLIVSANGTPTSRARVFQRVCRDLRAGEVLSLVIKRDEQVLSIDITLEEPR
jgi:serine protease Do